MADLLQLMQHAVDVDASDLHITVGVPPYYRVDGVLQQYSQEKLLPAEVEKMVLSIIPERHREMFQNLGEVDFNYSLDGQCRFRMNAYHQRNSIGLAARKIDYTVPTIESLKMPLILKDLAKKPQGLILVTGPTGSGKSSTLAAMINFINMTASKHIITLEDPIEYLHRHNLSIVNQREVGSDTLSFAQGLRASLRQDPDIIMVGEMRDLETISTAITAAETGHLVFATLHTSSAPSAIERIIDVFPPHQQGQVRVQLASVLQGIVCQRLFKRIDGPGSIAATEILTNTPSVANLIRNDKVHQIMNVIQTSRAQGMHTLASSIEQLVTKRLIDYEDAKLYMDTGEFL